MQKCNILLIEDDELDIRSVQRSLESLDTECRLLIARNGREALSMLEDQENLVMPDLILLELNMPKLNGVEFLKQIRGNDKFKHIKIIVMTTSADSADRDKAEELGVSGYIIKPRNYTDNGKRSDSMDSFVEFHLRKILTSELRNRESRF
jgi:CheY-like chemotaxis protein